MSQALPEIGLRLEMLTSYCSYFKSHIEKVTRVKKKIKSKAYTGDKPGNSSRLDVLNARDPDPRSCMYDMIVLLPL